MLSKNRIKFLKSLHQKKQRYEAQAFLVEGEKSLSELLVSDFEILELFITDAFFQKFENNILSKAKTYAIVKNTELESAGSLQSQSAGIAVVRMPVNQAPIIREGEYVLVLDNIQDPGNLGTIVRLADWYDIRHIICSSDTVDIYNPKTISATMGSFTRVGLFYTDLMAFLQANTISVYGTLLAGTNLHQIHFEPQGGLIILGNEAHGISPHLLPYIHTKLTIPRIGQAESLNVAMATAVICDNLRRQIPQNTLT
jgi:TrmH family RNA methyltransferase